MSVSIDVGYNLKSGLLSVKIVTKTTIQSIKFATEDYTVSQKKSWGNCQSKLQTKKHTFQVG